MKENRSLEWRIMAKESKDFSKHFREASKKAKELGYANMLDLDVRGTEEHKKIIRSIYKVDQQ